MTEPEQVPPPSHFAHRADNNDETWLEDAITAYLDLTLGPKQREICRSVVQNERTAVLGANGTGKTYITGAIVLAWQTVRYPAISFGTSGTGKKLYRTLCRPIDKLHSDALNGAGLPGEFKQQPPRIDYEDPEHYFEAASPQDAGELEGAHSAYTLAIIEEADKDDVTDATIDAMRSLIPDYEGSRMLAVGNPPDDEADVFAEITSGDSAWNVVRVSSFDSHNVLVETGAKDGEIIDGMATVSALRGDWNDYHDEEWPGVEQAQAWSDPSHEDFRDDLDSRWYKRRAGVIPPQTSQKWRPFTPSDVEAAYQRAVDPSETPDSFGIDVARSGDKTIGTAKYGPELRTEYARQGTNHVQQKEELTDKLYALNSPEIAVDAVGEGSGLADELADAFARVERFSNGMKPAEEREYYDAWAEALALFGDFLDSGGAITNQHLYEEAKVAARTVEFSTRSLTSRGGDVIEATAKERIKERLGHSPDYLDSALMAVWLDMAEQQTVEVVRRSGNRARSGTTR
jgi:hypothetical protein